MKKAILACVLLVLFSARPAPAQQAAIEAEIKRTATYSSMLSQIPGLTLEDYNEAVRQLARKELLKQTLSLPLPDPAPTYQNPYYTTPIPSYRTPSYPLPSTPRYTPRYSAPAPVAPTPPTFGRTYDWQSGNTYSWNRDPLGTTTVRGHNALTGSTWRTTIQPDGSQSGYDKNMNYWKFNSGTGTYMNFGTGEICVGSGAARVCTQ